MAEPDIGDVLKPNDRAATPHDDQLFQSFGVVEPADGAQEITPLAALDFAARRVAVARGHGATDVTERQFPLRQSCRVEQDLDLFLGASAEADI